MTGEIMELEKLRDIICDVLSVQESQIKKDTAFVEDLGADSFDLLSIVMETEQMFDVVIATENLKSVETVQDLLHLIRKAQEP